MVRVVSQRINDDGMLLYKIGFPSRDTEEVPREYVARRTNCSRLIDKKPWIDYLVSPHLATPIIPTIHRYLNFMWSQHHNSAIFSEINTILLSFWFMVFYRIYKMLISILFHWSSAIWLRFWNNAVYSYPPPKFFKK